MKTISGRIVFSFVFVYQIKEAKIVNTKQRQICAKIYEDNVERVRWYLWRKFEWLNKEDAHDIMQDVWRILSENIDTVGEWPPVAQWKWLETVAHNRVISFLRKAERNMEIDGEIEDYSGFSTTDSAEDSAIEKITAENILGKLSEADKKTIFEIYLQSDSSKKSKKKSNAEICRYYRAKKKLVKKMKEGGMDE